MQGSVQLVANYDDWKAVKKIVVTEKTDPLNVAEFLAGLTYSVDGKIEDNLRKKIELDKVDKAIKELNLNKNDVGKAISEVNSRSVSKVINEITKLDKFDGPAQKELNQLAKIYATKEAIRYCGLKVEYFEADLPNLKRAKKAAEKKK